MAKNRLSVARGLCRTCNVIEHIRHFIQTVCSVNMVEQKAGVCPVAGETAQCLRGGNTLEDPSLVPSTHIRQLRTSYNSSPRGPVSLLASVGYLHS